MINTNCEAIHVYMMMIENCSVETMSEITNSIKNRSFTALCRKLPKHIPKFLEQLALFHSYVYVNTWVERGKRVVLDKSNIWNITTRKINYFRIDKGETTLISIWEICR